MSIVIFLPQKKLNADLTKTHQNEMFLQRLQETARSFTSFAGVQSLSEFHGVIFDIGSSNFRVGYAGEETPRKVFRNAVSHRKYPIAITTGAISDTYIDDSDVLKSGALTLSWPVHHGIIKNWDDFEKVLSYGVRSVKVQMEEHPCLVCTSPVSDVKQKQKLAEIFLETFYVPSILYQPTDALSLLAYKKKTGLVVESGEGLTTISAFVDGYKQVFASRSVRVGGRSVTAYLLEKIRDDKLTGATGWTVAEEIKEKYCYVPMEYASEIKEAKAGKLNMELRMPNGTLKVIGPERIKVGDFLFRPRIWGLQSEGIHELATQAIRRTKLDVRDKIWDSIVLAGGNTLMNGFVERFKHEMEKVKPEGVTVNVLASEDRENAAFLGASFVAGMPSFAHISITREAYEEAGMDSLQFIEQRCT